MTVLTVSLTLVRPGDDAPQLFWARRRPDREFLGGFHAFFAGTVEPQDRAIADAADVETPHTRMRAAAIREAFEESGTLFTDEGVERFEPGARTPAIISDAAAQLALDRLELFGWWNTPEWIRPSYSTAFYGLNLTADEGERLDDLAEHLDDREFDGGEWIDAREAIDRWWSGDVFLTEPIRSVVEALETDNRPTLPTPPAFGSTQNRAGCEPLAEICGAVVMLPLETPTLPPATHTNCVIAGGDRFVVIDPGPSESEPLGLLFDRLHRRIQNGDEFAGVLLTHHHGDHVGGVDAVVERYDVPVFAHEKTLDQLTGTSNWTTHSVDDGNEIELDHPGPLTAVHTPGHASGHLAFYQADIDLLIGGDLVADEGTIIIDPPDGDMADYLDSLRRIRDLNPRALLPAHGQLITRPAAIVDEYIDHRRMREQKVLDAVREHGPAAPSELVPHAYPDAPEAVWPLAGRSLLAHLVDLGGRGIVEQNDAGRWSLL